MGPLCTDRSAACQTADTDFVTIFPIGAKKSSPLFRAAGDALYNV
jgi:hypothetical protein